MVDTTRRKFLGAVLGATATSALPKVKVIPKVSDELPADIAELVIGKGHPLRQYAGSDALHAELEALLDSWVPKGLAPKWQPVIDRTATDRSPAANAAADAVWDEARTIDARLVDIARRGDPKAYSKLRAMGLDHDDIRDALRAAHVSLAGIDRDPAPQANLISKWGTNPLWDFVSAKGTYAPPPNTPLPATPHHRPGTMGIGVSEAGDPPPLSGYLRSLGYPMDLTTGVKSNGWDRYSHLRDRMAMDEVTSGDLRAFLEHRSPVPTEEERNAVSRRMWGEN